MKQLSLAATDFVKKPRQTRREKFLLEMEAVVPWSRLLAVIEPHYPKAGNGRRPFELSAMLRIHFMQQWFSYSDPAMEEALHDIPLLAASPDSTQAPTPCLTRPPSSTSATCSKPMGCRPGCLPR